MDDHYVLQAKVLENFCRQVIYKEQQLIAYNWDFRNPNYTLLNIKYDSLTGEVVKVLCDERWQRRFGIRNSFKKP